VLESGDGAFYALTPLGKAHLVDEGPDLERSALLHRPTECGACWNCLRSFAPARLLKTGAGGTSAHSRRPWASGTRRWWRR